MIIRLMRSKCSIKNSEKENKAKKVFKINNITRLFLMMHNMSQAAYTPM